MIRKTKTVRNDTPWPSHWQVLTEWDVPAEIKLPRGSDRHLVSRKSEVALKGSPSSWLLFDKYVYNPENDKEWIDAFIQGHFASFTAFRPDQIAKVRARVIPKRLAKPTETVRTNGET
jgi:hypothetical protein